MDWNMVVVAIGVVSGVLTIGVVVAGWIGLARAPKATFSARAESSGDLWLSLTHSGGTGAMSNVTIGIENLGDDGTPTSGDWPSMSWAPHLAAGQTLVYEIFDPKEVQKTDPAPRPHETWRHLYGEDGIVAWVRWEQRPLWWLGQRLVLWDASARRSGAQPVVLSGRAAARKAAAVTKRIERQQEAMRRPQP